MAEDGPRFRVEPSPDHPGWLTWELTDAALFNGSALGPMIVRREDGADGTVRCRLRLFAGRRHANLAGAIHGGAILGLIDVSLFAGLQLIAHHDAGAAVTLDLVAQFIGAGRIGEPLDAVVEILRETGRMAFMRGLVEQSGETVAAFSGTVRKLSRP